MYRFSIIALVALVIFLAPNMSFGKELTMAEKISLAKGQLNGTEWTINVKVAGAAEGEADVISFSDGKFTSRNFSNVGYGPSAFSVRIKGDMTIWETMQQKTDKDGNKEIVMWRGDITGSIDNGAMSGVCTKTSTNAKGKEETLEFYFTAVQ